MLKVQLLLLLFIHYFRGLSIYILGISAFYHDSAACLLKDGEIIAAAQEERFIRKKHYPGFPHNAIKYCLNEAKISPDLVTNVVFYEKPLIKFERLLETYLATAPRGFLSFLKIIPLWIKDKLFQKSALIRELESSFGHNVNWRKRLLFSEHHLSHAASAFFPSPFRNAAVLTLDGVGEWTTSSIAVGELNNLKILKEIHFPHSLGLLYSAFTFYLGFKVNSDEYKVMGLAPYGSPCHYDLIREKLINFASDGSFQLNLSYFDYLTGLTMTNNKFNALFGGPPRKPETKISQREMDIAASVQKVTEDVIIEIAKNIAKETGEKNLCLAGGVALNCVTNGILFRTKIFDNIWIQPAAGDAGGALGAALSVWYLHHKGKRKTSIKFDNMKGSYLGPEFTDIEIETELKLCGAVYRYFNESALINEVVKALINQKVVGWMQGRMEFGPRALGGRSIIADPRSKMMHTKLNLKVKYRESFRPFAPSILYEEVRNWFEHDTESPYMLLVANVHKEKLIKMTKEDEKLLGTDKLKAERSIIPAVTHVDNSARIQTVHSQTNPRFHALLSEFKAKTSCPIIINTSFNVRDEPIICTPTDAFKCFMGTEIDVLAVGNFLLTKEEQYMYLKNYKRKNEEHKS